MNSKEMALVIKQLKARITDLEKDQEKLLSILEYMLSELRKHQPATLFFAAETILARLKK